MDYQLKELITNGNRIAQKNLARWLAIKAMYLARNGNVFNFRPS